MYNNRKFGRRGKSKSKCKGTTNKKVGKDECVFCHNKEHGKNDRHLLNNKDEKDFNANVAE